MKSISLLAVVLGLGAGMGIRQFRSRPSVENSAPDTLLSTTRRPSLPERADLPPPLQWGLNGDLKSADLLKLPNGARRDAETVLWALNATPAELAAHWDRLLASEGSWSDGQQFMMIWVEKDPLGALAHTEGTAFKWLFYQSYARSDQERALALIKEKDPDYYGAVLGSIGKDDPDRAMELIATIGMPGRDTFGIFREMVEGYFKRDPEEALDFVEDKHLHGEGNEYFRRWADQDPRAAFAWGLENRAFEIYGTMSLFKRNDPVYVASEIDRLPTGSFKNKMLSWQAGFLAQKDPRKAIALAESQPGRGKGELLNKIGEALVRRDPETSMEVLGKIFDSGQLEYDEGMSPLDNDWVLQLIDQDAHGVLELAEKADRETGGNLSEETLKEWLNVDAPSAAAYLESDKATHAQKEIYRTMKEEK